jgi:hypothetical protein
MVVIHGKDNRKHIINTLRGKTAELLKPGTHYPHVTWAHVMLRVQLVYLTLNSGAHSHFCHSSYVTRSYVGWRTHFVRQNVCANRNLRGVLACEPTRAPHQIAWRKQSDRSVSVRQNSMLNIPTTLVTSRELTWREDSVSPALQSGVFHSELS